MTVREPVVCCYESRRAEEMRALIERQNAQVIVAPSMKEVPLEENQSGLDAIRQVLAGRVDSIVLLTGVGTEAMLDLAATAGLRDELLTAMNSIPLLVRGPKPAAVLHRLGLKFLVKAAEPNTSRELLDAIDQADLSFQGKVVAVQEYGVANPDLYDALKERGANVLPISVYSWALPDDIGPLQSSIEQTILGRIDVLMFTSAQQVRHVRQIADDAGRLGEWQNAAGRCFVASIGPTCSEAIREIGLPVHFESSPPKMGPMVRDALNAFRSRQSNQQQ